MTALTNVLKRKKILMSALFAGLVMPLAACDRDDDLGDKLEEAGDEVTDSVEDAGDEIEDAVDDK
ncbi:hypothetical protein [Emcibacter sp.]|uniref:hypothetical protein n=1 Tax=Emcibacter sp. TaxID=1979954 RepID=UPI003A9352D7